MLLSAHSTTVPGAAKHKPAAPAVQPAGRSRRCCLRVSAAAATAPPASAPTADATAKVVADEAQYVLQTYGRPADVVFVKGQGSKLYDMAGKEYLDMAAGEGIVFWGGGVVVVVCGGAGDADTHVSQHHSCVGMLKRGGGGGGLLCVFGRRQQQGTRQHPQDTVSSSLTVHQWLSCHAMLCCAHPPTPHHPPTPGIAVNALGHGDPTWLSALTAQAQQLSHTSNLFHTVPQVRGGAPGLCVCLSVTLSLPVTPATTPLVGSL